MRKKGLTRGEKILYTGAILCVGFTFVLKISESCFSTFLKFGETFFSGVFSFLLRSKQCVIYNRRRNAELSWRKTITVSGAGNVATSALEMSQNGERLHWSFEKVDAKLKGIMVDLYHNIDEAAKKYGFEGNFVVGANIAGFEKVVDAMNAQGIV